MRIPVELRHAYRLLNHGPTTLITSAHGEKRNVMAAAWVMAIDYEPPKLCAVIAGDTYTRELIDGSGEFVVNLPPKRLLQRTYLAGSLSGRSRDKYKDLALKTSPADKVAPPLLEGCVGWLECRVIPRPDNQKDFDLFVAEVVAAHVEDRCWTDGMWAFPDDDSRTVHHISKGQFFLTGAPVLAMPKRAAKPG